MTPRERFRRLMKGESVDRLPVLALEPYESSALERWRREGLPADASPTDFLGMSRLTHVPVSFAPMPCFEARVLHEDETYVVDTTYLGATVRRRKDQPDMFYGHVDHPIKTRADWEQYKERLLAESPGRLPDNWHQEVVPRLRSSEHPVGVCLFPFFFRFCFYTLGMERFLSAFHEEPDLVRDIFSHLGQFFLEILRPVVSSVELDYVLFAEDLAGKNGPLISPKTYEDFWYPYQDPIVRLFHDHDVPLVCQWS
ncbi:MAG: hypothetical protein HY318_18845, partial [Armatimonadetes bacterium]|nr:hypothetical protein [Armatimonadota bacterium]